MQFIFLFSFIISSIFSINNFCINSSRPAFDKKKAFVFLVEQCSFGPRNPGSAGHSKCLQYLNSTLKKYSSNVRLQNFSHFDPKKNVTLNLTNLIASFPGTSVSGEKILLCAHWDTRPHADQDTADRDKPIIGANDGASGVAVLLEIARLFKNSPPPIGVDIIFFDGEDYGQEGDLAQYLLGSKYFAANNPPLNYRSGILLDLIGEKDLSIPKEKYSYDYLPDYVDKVWEIAAYLGKTVFINEIGPEVYDDHKPLIDAGIPCIDIIDFDYKYWHTHADTPDKCSEESLFAVGEVVLEFVYSQN